MKQQLFFFFIIEIYSFTKKISDYYSDSNGLLTTLLSIGDPTGKMRYFQIDLEIPFNWIQSTSYEVGYSNALQFVRTDDVTIENVNTQCKLYQDYIKFPGSGVEIGKFFFYINQNESIKGFSSLSFSLQPGSEVFSLSKKLKELGTINNNRFGFVPRHLPQSTNKESIILFSVFLLSLEKFICSIKDDFSLLISSISSVWVLYPHTIFSINSKLESIVLITLMQSSRVSILLSNSSDL